MHRSSPNGIGHPARKVAEGLTDEQKDAIRGAVNGGMYKQAPQAKDWVGHAVANALGLDIDDEVQKKRTSLVTKALFKGGFLAKVEERYPVQRKTTSFVRAFRAGPMHYQAVEIGCDQVPIGNCATQNICYLSH